MRLFVDLLELFVDPLAGLVAHEARDGHGHGGEYLPVLHKDDAALLTLQLLDGEGHLVIIDADDNDIVRIVRDREGNGTGLDAIALQEGRGDVAGGLVALDHGNLDEVDGGVADEIAGGVDLNIGGALLRDDAAGQDADDVDVAALEVHFQLFNREILQDDAALDGGSVDLRDSGEVFSVLGGQLARRPDLADAEVLEIVEQDDVGALAGGEDAAVVEAEALRGVDRGHPDGGDGVEPLFDTDAEMVVQMALMEHGARLPVVGAEDAAAGVAGGDALEHRAEIVAGRALAQHDVHATADALVHLLDGGALVVSQDAGGGVGVEVFAVDRGSVAVDDLAVLLGEDDLVQRGAVGAQDAGEVHKFAEAENFGTSDRLFHFLRADDCAGMLERRGGDTGGEHVLDVERGVLRGVDHVIEARQAADVDDLVRVGNDGGAAVGDKETADLFGGDVGRFNVDMAVDEAGGGIAAVRVDGLAALIWTDAGDLAVAEGDVALDDLAGADVDDPAVLDDGVGRDAPGGNVDQMRKRFPCFHDGSLLLFRVQSQDWVEVAQGQIIHRPCVGHGIVGDGSDWEEEHVHHRIWQVRAERANRIVDLFFRDTDLFRLAVADNPADRQWKKFHDLAAVDHDLAAALLDQIIDRNGHIFGVNAHHNDVVVVRRCTGGHRAPLQLPAGTEG